MVYRSGKTCLDSVEWSIGQGKEMIQEKVYVLLQFFLSGNPCSDFVKPSTTHESDLYKTHHQNFFYIKNFKPLRSEVLWHIYLIYTVDLVIFARF